MHFKNQSNMLMFHSLNSFCISFFIEFHEEYFFIVIMSVVLEKKRNTAFFNAYLGGLSSIFAATLTHPVDLIKVRFQL